MKTVSKKTVLIYLTAAACLILLPVAVNIPIEYLNLFFMVGLLLFIAGGFMWMMNKGVYNAIFNNFKKILRHDSKLETFVAEQDAELKDKRNFRRTGSGLWVLSMGILLIVFSTIVSMY
ncbi:DUF3899 domain-containing protein [Salinicoccus siamensis]|uniref:DUF3899 domain-containing protein n=1 Tax=Salinicoccus siamensis TaxID=381830 RepID=A0ABV5Z3A9_9STAP